MAFYDVNSSIYLVTFFVFALVETLLCSGITYGWASIVVVFKMEYFYMDLCKDWYRSHNESLPTWKPKYQSLLVNKTIVGGGAGYYNNGELPGCLIQDARLNLIFTVSLFCLCGIKFPAGVFIDKYGPKIAQSVGGTMYVIAALGLGFVTVGYENLLFPVFAFIGIGGSLLVVSVYQVSNIVFRKSRSRVMCILHGAFDSSAVFLLVFKLIYEAGVEFKYITYGYAIACSVLVILGTFVLIPPKYLLFRWVDEELEMTGRKIQRSVVGPVFVMKPSNTHKDFAVFSIEYGSCKINGNSDPTFSYNSCEKKSQQQETGNYNALDSSSEFEEEMDEANYYQNSYKDSEVLVKSQHKSPRFPKGSVLRSIFLPLYLLELVYLTVFQLKLWYYVGILPGFLERITKDKESTVSEYINLFGYIQFGGLIVTPILGFLFDRDTITKKEKQVVLTEAEQRLKRLKKCILPFTITNVLCLIFCFVSLLEDLRVQVISFILYTTVRGFLYANHGTYMGSAFPPSQFGTLYGFGIFVGGCFGILQYALFEFTSNVLDGNPFWSNILLLTLVAIGNIHPIYLWWYCRNEDKKLAKKRFRTTQLYSRDD